MKYWTGVGSRETPSHIIELMLNIAYKLAQEGYTLRSGAAQGADTAFEQGVVRYYKEHGESFPAPEQLAQIYTPWYGFVDIPDDYKDWYKVLNETPNKLRAEQIASEIHPAWDKCSRGAKALHTRNVYQILGASLNTRSQFLICYAKPTKDGVAGGTNTAWQLAKKYNISCFNLYNTEDRKRIEGWLG